MSLLDRRLLVVTGKGGVGRSTCAAALAVAAGRRGRRTAVLELSGQSALPPLFGLPGRSFAFRRATDNVWAASLTVAECLDDFGQRKLKLPGLMRRLFRTRATRTFVDAIPGLHDLLQLGKIENLVNEPAAGDLRFDLVIVDAPATGHGLTLLSAARSMTEVAKAGPFHELAQTIERFLSDPAATASVLVTLPEELPVSESLELIEALEATGRPPAMVLANRCLPSVLPDDLPLDAALAHLAAVPHGQALADLLDLRGRRLDAQARALQLLDEGTRGVPVVALPRLAPHRLAHALGDHLAEVLP